MTEIDQESVTRIFMDVLEKMAFMFGEPADLEDLEDPDEPVFEASMRFDGESSGEIRLFVPGSLCTELAANVLGIDNEDEKALRIGQDALKELLNTLCGQILTAMVGEVPVFDLSVPEISEVDHVAWSDSQTEEGVYLFDVEEHPVLLDVSKIG